LAAILVTTISAFYFKYRINGVTGDCFGATNQLTEIAVYLCGVWH
jgi:adenosylcobinamide-GDP ribazoletransferase